MRVKQRIKFEKKPSSGCWDMKKRCARAHVQGAPLAIQEKRVASGPLTTHTKFQRNPSGRSRDTGKECTGTRMRAAVPRPRLM